MAAEFGLHPLVVDDAIAAHQRPKLERYGDILFTVLRPARYIDQRERVEFGELHVITGDGFVVTIRRAEAPISRASAAAWNRSRTSYGSDQRPSLQHHGPGRRRIRPSLQGSRTTSTKSKTSSSATTPPSHAASTPSHVK